MPVLTMSTPRHHLGDAVLHLDARVHLHEVEAAVAVEQELDGAGALVVRRRRRRPRRPRPSAAAASGLTAGDGASSMSFWWRRWMRAVALAEVDAVTLAVGEHLDLDVARRARCTSPRRRRRCRTRPRPPPEPDGRRRPARGLRGDADALAAAAGRRLDHHRQADVARDHLGLRGALDRALGAGGDRAPRRRSSSPAPAPCRP